MKSISITGKMFVSGGSYKPTPIIQGSFIHYTYEPISGFLNDSGTRKIKDFGNTLLGGI